MPQCESAKNLLKKLFEITTKLPDGEFLVGNVNLEDEFGQASIYSIGTIYNMDSKQGTRVLSDGNELQNKLAIQICKDICSQPKYRKFESVATDHEWKKLTKKSYANVLKDLSKKDSNTSKTLSELIDLECFLNKLKQKIISELKTYKHPRKYIFGCHISNKVLEPIKIGPVLFEHRSTWHESLKLENGYKLKLDIEFIKSKWQGLEADLRSGNVWVQFHTDNFLDTIEKADYVCTVKLKNQISHGIGRYYALNAARLALTTISLGFQTPSKALEHMFLNWDRNSTRQDLFLMVENDCGHEFKHQQFSGGIMHLSRNNWQDMLNEMDNIFLSTGKILSWFINGASDPDPKTISPEKSIFHALLWFYKGCVEENVQMAIHNFMASLDSLSGKQNAEGIKEKLIEAGISNQDLANKISKLYSNVRSLLTHGKYDQLGQINYDDRIYAEMGAKFCLIHKLENYNNAEL